jgi:hypothetical protein
VQLEFAKPLAPGDYTLIAKSTITDVTGRQLDGNADGISGDDYIERFTVVPPPLSLGSAVEIISPGAVPQDPVMAVNPIDHSYVVVWQGPGLTAGESDIYARRYHAHGSPLGDVVRVNTFLPGAQFFPGDQTAPSIAMDDQGNYVIVWDSTIVGAIGHVVNGRRFAADGTPLGVDGSPANAEQFQVDGLPRTSTTLPRVAVDADGDFVVTWQGNDPGNSANGSEIFAKRFSRQTGALEPPISVNEQSPAGDQQLPRVAMDANGNFLVTWNSINGGANDVRARWFSATGAREDEFLVNSTTVGIQHSPRLAMNRDGEFAIVWRNEIVGVGDNVYAQRYDRERRPIGAQFRVHDARVGQQSLPDVAIDKDGNLLILWAESETAAGDGYSARWFDKWGNVLADEFRVADIQSSSVGQATVGMALDGEFIIAWPEQDISGIMAQRYTLLPPTVVSVDPASTTSGHGIVVGFSQQMATSGAGSALEPASWALRLADGRYLVQSDAASQGTDPRATPEQFGAISFAFNSATERWEATLPLNFTLTAGTYQLIARNSLQDAASRKLDGNGDGIPSENYFAEFTVLAGDYDLDDQVDSDDYGVWRSSFGLSGHGLTSDGNGDNVVDAADYVIWPKNLGATSGLAQTVFIASDTSFGAQGADTDQLANLASGSSIDELWTIPVINLERVRTSMIASVDQSNGQISKQSFDKSDQIFDVASDPASQTHQVRPRRPTYRPVKFAADVIDELLLITHDRFVMRNRLACDVPKHCSPVAEYGGGEFENADLAFAAIAEEDREWKLSW